MSVDTPSAEKVLADLQDTRAATAFETDLESKEQAAREPLTRDLKKRGGFFIVSTPLKTIPEEPEQ